MAPRGTRLACSLRTIDGCNGSFNAYPGEAPRSIKSVEPVQWDKEPQKDVQQGTFSVIGEMGMTGTLVMAPGDLNLTFKRYLESSVRLKIDNDYVTAIEGTGLDAELMREYFAAWGDKEAYAVSHVGWGMNRGARWEAMTMYDKRDCNGTEQRAFAGNFLYSTGANEVAGRHTLGHYDLPLRHCTVTLDGQPVVADGVPGTGKSPFSARVGIGHWPGTPLAMAASPRSSPTRSRTSRGIWSPRLTE